MTPKEKAQELYHKYFSMIKIESPIDRVSSIPYVKNCALIAVDELIKYHDDIMDVVRYELPSNIIAVIPYKYWEEVKKEIENL